MSSSRTILPRLAQFGEPGIGPAEGSLKIKQHQHIAGKIITRGLSRGVRGKWSESASKLHIGGPDIEVTDECSDGLDLALSGIQDKSVHLPVIDDGTFHRQTPTPDVTRSNKTPIPGVGYWTKRGGKHHRPASVLQELYLSEDETPHDSKADLTLTIEGQADPRLLPKRSTITPWKLNKSPDGGTLHPPPTTPNLMHEYDEMFRSIEEDMKQILLCQSFGIMIEKHKSTHGMVATPIFHCPRCLKHWSVFGMPLQNCENANQPTKGPDFQLNKKNHHIFQKFTRLPSKDKEHIIVVIQSPRTSNKSLDQDASTESLLILKDLLSEDDDDNANMFPGSTQDLGSTLIARRASIEVKSQNEQRSSQSLAKLKSQRSMHKKEEHRYKNEKSKVKTTHRLEHEGERMRQAGKTNTKDMKSSDNLQNGQFGTVFDDWTNQKGGHLRKENVRQSYKNNSFITERTFDGESEKYKPVGKFTFGPDTSEQTSVGLVGPDGGYYIGTYDERGQFAPISRINADGSTCPMQKGPDDLFYPQDDTYYDKAETETTGVCFSFTGHDQHTGASPGVQLQSEFINLKDEEQTNLQKFSTLPRDLKWDYEECSEGGVLYTKREKPGNVSGNAATNVNLNHHGEQEENVDRKYSSDESNQQAIETATTADDQSVIMEDERNMVKKEDKHQGREKDAEEGFKNETSTKENERKETSDNASGYSSSEQHLHFAPGRTEESKTVLEEILFDASKKDFRNGQQDLDNDIVVHENHANLLSSLGQGNEQTVTTSKKDVRSKSALSEKEHESGISNDSFENTFRSHSSLMLVKHYEASGDKEATDTVNYGSEFSVTVTDGEDDIVEEDITTNINIDNSNKEWKRSKMEAGSNPKIKTDVARIRKGSIVPQMGSQDILPSGSDSHYDAYASKRGQKGTAKRNGKGHKRASIDHQGKVKNPAVKNVTGRPDTKAGALKKHMLATPKSLLAQNMSYEITQQKAEISQHRALTSEEKLQSPEMGTIAEKRSVQAAVSTDKEIPPQKSLLEGNEEIDRIQNEVAAVEQSDETILPEGEDLSPSKQKTKMRRPPKKEKLPVMRERKRVSEQKNDQEEGVKDITSMEGYSNGEVSREQQNELPEIVRSTQEKADSTLLSMKQSLPQISAPLNKKESFTRIKSAAESLEKLSLSKFSQLQVNLNQSLGLDQPTSESTQASFRMTYSTLPGKFDTRKRSSKSLLLERKQSANKLPSLPTIQKTPSARKLDSRAEDDLGYMVIPKGPSPRGMTDSQKRSLTSSLAESEEEETIWESVSEMWMKHSKEIRRFSNLEEYSYLPLTKAFTFSFFDIPFQYVEKNKELKIRGNMIKSMKRPPRMKIKGKKKRPPTAELKKLLEEKRNQVKKHNIVYKLWQMEQRNSCVQPIPKLGSF